MQAYQKPVRPFQVTAEHVSYSGLDTDDLGRWSLPVTGCHHLFDTKEEAFAVYRFLMEDFPAR